MILFKSGSNSLEMVPVDAKDLLMAIDRPYEARTLRGTWSFEQLVVMYGRILRLRNIEDTKFVDKSGLVQPPPYSSDHVCKRLDAIFKLVKYAINTEQQLCFS